MIISKKILSLKKSVTACKKRYRKYEEIQRERERLRGPAVRAEFDADLLNGLANGLAGLQGNAGQGPKKKRKIRERDYKNIDLKDLDRMHGEGIDVDFADYVTINDTYPLTPPYPEEGETVYAWVNICWNENEKTLEYCVIEPELSDGEARDIERIKTVVEDKLNVHFDSERRDAARKYLMKQIDEVMLQLNMRLPPETKNKYNYYLLRNFVDLDKLQPVLNDPNIEDISCDGVGIPVFVYHKNPKYGSLKSNVVFNTREELDDFVMRMAQRCGRTISVAEPVFQGALPDGSRVQSTLETDIAKRGSNFTIRKFSKEPMTPIHLLEYGGVDAKMLAYLWFVIERGKSILVCGPTASGKTTLLNALSLFIRPNMKIVSIEDTPELRLPHIHWIPEIAREGISAGGATEKRIGEVSMFDLLRGALRQRPDYIIVGEVRGKEAFILFQAMATGHAGLSTMHADSVEKVIDRLTTPPIQLPSSLLETLDMIIFAKRLRYREHNVRRTVEIHEINSYDADDKYLDTSRVFRWNASSDTFDIDEESDLLGKLCRDEGITEAKLKAEIKNRVKVLKWMKEKDIKNYTDVGEMMERYYSNPAGVLEMIEEG